MRSGAAVWTRSAGAWLGLAGALAITTVITFMLVVTGVSAGFFGGRSDGGEAAAEGMSPEELAGALLYLAAQASPTVAVQEVVTEPRIVTEYVYVYETVTSAGKVQAAGVAPTAPAAAAAAIEPEPTEEPEPTVAPLPTQPPVEEEDDAEEEDDGAREHEEH